MASLPNPLDLLAESVREIADGAALSARRARDLGAELTAEYHTGVQCAFVTVLQLIEDEKARLQEIEDEHVEGRVYGPGTKEDS